MRFYLITGVPASGKTTMVKAMQRHHLSAVDADHFLHWVRKGTDEHVESPPIQAMNREWFKRHEAVLDQQKLDKHLGSHQHYKYVFLAGSAARQEQEYERFHKIFLLTLDDETLKRRLRSRPAYKFGSSEESLNYILEFKPWFEQQALAAGAIPLDATLPPENLIVQIFEHIEAAEVLLP